MNVEASIGIINKRLRSFKLTASLVVLSMRVAHPPAIDYRVDVGMYH
jgi:hypothetical protein